MRARNLSVSSRFFQFLSACGPVKDFRFIISIDGFAEASCHSFSVLRIRCRLQPRGGKGANTSSVDPRACRRTMPTRALARPQARWRPQAPRWARRGGMHVWKRCDAGRTFAHPPSVPQNRSGGPTGDTKTIILERRVSKIFGAVPSGTGDMLLTRALAASALKADMHSQNKSLLK